VTETQAAAVTFDHVDILFGDDTTEALALLDKGAGRGRILQQTGVVVGVADANLSVREGEICVLMGLSGSGKSTLVRAVNGLADVTRGRVLVNDGGEQVDVTRCGPGVLRRLRSRRVAMVFQQFALLPWRTVRENVGFGLELRGVGRAERDRVVEEKLRLVALSDWADKFAHELSGGMQQRVGLARAFATDADILLMDEPFSALDPLIRDKLQDELLGLQQALRKTILFVSHDLDEALKIGNRIAIMEAGRIVQVGTPEEIVLSPANAYVAEFVQHMNPMRVLRGRSIMAPVGALAQRDGWRVLDSAAGVRVRLNGAGGVEAAEGAGGPLEVDHWTPDTPPEAVAAGRLGLAPAGLTLREAVALRRASGLPLGLLEDGRLAGVCGDGEIYGALLRRAEADAGDG